MTRAFVVLGLVALGVCVITNVHSEDSLTDTAKMFGDLLAQSIEGKVSQAEAKTLFVRFLRRMRQKPNKPEKKASKSNAPLLPIVQEAGEAHIRVKFYGKPPVSVFKTPNPKKISFARILVPDTNHDNRWDKSFKAIRVVAPEDGIVVLAEQGKVWVFGFKSGRVWLFEELGWLAVSAGETVSKGALLGHLSGTPKTTALLVRVITFQDSLPVWDVVPKFRTNLSEK